MASDRRSSTTSTCRPASSSAWIRSCLCREAQLVKTCRFGDREVLVREVGEGRATPVAKRLGQSLGRLVSRTARQRCPTRGREALETCRVQLFGLEVQPIARGVALQTTPFLTEYGAEAGDVDVQGVAGLLWHFLGPQLLDEVIGADGLPGADDQAREQAALTTRAELTQLSRLPDL